LAAMVISPTAVGAQPEDGAPDDEEAKEAAGKFLKAGDKLIKEGDYNRSKKREDKAVDKYSRALEAYQRAFDIYPRPQLYWLIGLAEHRLGQHLDALRHYQQLLREVPDLNEDLRAQVQLNIEEAKQQVVTVTFKVTPDDATIAVDGEDVGSTPFEDPVYLAPGEHVIAVIAEGYLPYETTVSLEAGSESERTIDLEKIPIVVTKPRPRPVRPPPPPPAVSRTPLIIGVTATAALGTVATVTGLLAVSKHGSFSDESLSEDDRESARSSGKNLALITDLLWAGTIAAGAFTAYHYYKVYKPKTRSRERQIEERRKSRELSRSLQIVPYAAPETAGVAVIGSF
ncbi:MAG TPA: PEGA domain-containing protein, partial [Kofleriaceae bacterium]|nr:PEGA domain-containing protein [Kofleriaceae bacterium]